jgi:preprotein translocase subunit SecG
MYTLVAILIFIVCLLLVGIILIQESKGGGLASGFASSNQVMGVKKTGDFLEKATWTLAIALLVLSLVAAAVQTPGTIEESVQQSEIKDFIEGDIPNTFQTNPAPVPQQQAQPSPAQQPAED